MKQEIKEDRKTIWLKGIKGPRLPWAGDRRSILKDPSLSPPPPPNGLSCLEGNKEKGRNDLSPLTLLLPLTGLVTGQVPGWQKKGKCGLGWG